MRTVSGANHPLQNSQSAVRLQPPQATKVFSTATTALQCTRTGGCLSFGSLNRRGQMPSVLPVRFLLTSFFRDPTYLNPPQLPILEHAVASAAPAASYKSP
jgi:hypothetical protein